MPDTVRTIATLLSSLFQDGQAAGAITPQDMRDLIVSMTPPETTLSFSATLAWDLNVAPTAIVTLTGNTTITASNGENGRSYRLAVVQDGTGSRAVVLAGVTLLNTPAWRTAAGSVNILSIDVVGGVRYATVL